MRTQRRGLTLLELLIAVTVMALLGTGIAALAGLGLNTYSFATARAEALQDGMLLMDRISSNMRRCIRVRIPNARVPTGSTLAITGFLNDDDDTYFGSSFFPKVDEDSGNDANADLAPGIAGIDDDGDGSIDEGGLLAAGNNDEDGAVSEDWVNGMDDDGDGDVDEDSPADQTQDNKPGIAGFDDDDNNGTDEGGLLFSADDDEDGLIDEDSESIALYTFDAGTKTLSEKLPGGANTALSTRVTSFTVTRQSLYLYLITLTVEGRPGDTITLSELVHPRNTRQRLGKRVL